MHKEFGASYFTDFQILVMERKIAFNSFREKLK